MSTFTWMPDFGASKRITPRVRSISFGDGYEQRASYGINTKPKVWSLTFSKRTDSDALAIDTFLSNAGGVQYFNWTPHNGTLGKYICKEWSVTQESFNMNTVQATFQEVFEA